MTKLAKAYVRIGGQEFGFGSKREATRFAEAIGHARRSLEAEIHERVATLAQQQAEIAEQPALGRQIADAVRAAIPHGQRAAHVFVR